MSLRLLFIDLNSYFASVEQQLRPELRGRPVAVVPMVTGNTSVIAASYEAKKFGVKTGTLARDAMKMCPGLVLCSGHVSHYVDFHHKVLAAAETVLPVHAVHSIDEFSCRLLGKEREKQNAIELARAMKHAIARDCGECIRCSVGVAPNRWLAKIASDMMKPDGLVVIEAHELPDRLCALQLMDFPGIGPRMNARLARRGITTVAQLGALSRLQMIDVWGSVWGDFMWRAMRGEDIAEPKTSRSSFGHQHVLPPEKRNEAGARAVAAKLLAKAATRLRFGGYCARRLVLSIRFLDRDSPLSRGARGEEIEPNKDHKPLVRNRKAEHPPGSRPRGSWHAEASFPETDDSLVLQQALMKLWDSRPREAPPLRVGVTLVDLVPRGFATGALFEEARRTRNLGSAIDRINAKLGRHSVYFAAMHEARESAPTRIAFNHIPDLAMPEVADELGASDADDACGGEAR